MMCNDITALSSQFQRGDLDWKNMVLAKMNPKMKNPLLWTVENTINNPHFFPKNMFFNFVQNGHILKNVLY